MRTLTGRIAVVLFWLAMSATVAMAVLTVVDVALRYVLHSPVPGAYELGGYLSAVTVSLALPQIQRVKGHIVVDFAVRSAPLPLAWAMAAFVLTLQFAFYAALAWRLGANALELLAAGQRSDILRLPVYAIYLVVALGPAATALVVLGQFADPPPRREG